MVDDKKMDDEKIAKKNVEQILEKYNELTPENLAKIPQLAQLKTVANASSYTISYKVSYKVGKAE